MQDEQNEQVSKIKIKEDVQDKQIEHNVQYDKYVQDEIISKVKKGKR